MQHHGRAAHGSETRCPVKGLERRSEVHTALKKRVGRKRHPVVIHAAVGCCLRVASATEHLSRPAKHRDHARVILFDDLEIDGLRQLSAAQMEMRLQSGGGIAHEESVYGSERELSLEIGHNHIGQGKHLGIGGHNAGVENRVDFAQRGSTWVYFRVLRQPEMDLLEV